MAAFARSAVDGVGLHTGGSRLARLQQRRLVRLHGRTERHRSRVRPAVVDRWRLTTTITIAARRDRSVADYRLAVLAGPFQAVGGGVDKFVLLEGCLGLLIHCVLVFLCARRRRVSFSNLRDRSAQPFESISRPGNIFPRLGFCPGHRLDPAWITTCDGQAGLELRQYPWKPPPPPLFMHHRENKADAMPYRPVYIYFSPLPLRRLEGQTWCLAPHLPLLLFY